MVRQPIAAETMAAMADEMMKIALAPMNPLKALKVGKFSTNVGSGARSSIKMKMPALPAAPPAGRVTTVGGSSIAAQTPGVNIRTPTTQSPKMPLQTQVQGAGIPPASPIHVAPQTTPHAATVRQGAPQTVNTASPAAGTAQSGPASSAGRVSAGGAR
jgi:hypothetical protein